MYCDQTQNVGILKNSSCDKNQIVTQLKIQIFTKHKFSNSKKNFAQIGTKLNTKIVIKKIIINGDNT